MHFIKNLFNNSHTIDFYTEDYMVYEYFKIQKGIKFMPEWWKSIDFNSDIDKRPSEKLNTTKRCPGIINTFSQSFIMPLWSEIDFMMDENYNWNAKVSDQNTKILSHNLDQAGTFLNKEEFTHLKIISPWFAEEKKGIKWVIAPCSWSSKIMISDYFIPTSIRSFNISHSNTVHGFVKNKEQRINMKAGMPLIHMFPLTDKKIELKCHYDPDKVKKLKSVLPHRFAFNSNYYNKYKLMK